MFRIAEMQKLWWAYLIKNVTSSFNIIFLSSLITHHSPCEHVLVVVSEPSFAMKASRKHHHGVKNGATSFQGVVSNLLRV